MAQCFGVMFERGLRRFLQRGPATPGVIGRVRDVAQQAQPLDVGTRDVALGDLSLHFLRAGAVGMQQRVEEFGGAFAVIDGQAVFEVTVVIDEAVGAATNGGEAFGAAIHGQIKLGAAAQVREVMHELFGGITFVFQSSDDGQAFAVLKEAEDFAASRGHAIGINEAKRAPGMNRRAKSRLASVAGSGFRRVDARFVLHDDAALPRCQKQTLLAVFVSENFDR